MSGQVGKNGRSLLDAQTTLVVVYKDGDTPVRSELREPRLLLDIIHDTDGLIDIIDTVPLLEFLQGGY